MTLKKIEEAKKFIARDREEVVDILVDFSITDLLIFWGTEKELLLRQEQQWKPILNWLEELLSVKFNYSSGLDVPNQHPETNNRIRAFVSGLSEDELAVYYASTMILRSTLLAMAFVKKRIDAEEAFQASFIEELWQAESWGIVVEAEERRSAILAELKFLEKVLK
ncbi:MAG: hypothetical protein ACK5N8_00555 [Alphaproteobacteria bacterium]